MTAPVEAGFARREPTRPGRTRRAESAKCASDGALDLGHDAGVMPKFLASLCCSHASVAPRRRHRPPCRPRRPPRDSRDPARPLRLRRRLSPGDPDLPSGPGQREADPGGQRRRRPGALVPRLGSGRPLPVRRERGGRGAGAGLRHRSGDRRADPAERSALGRVRPRAPVGGSRRAASCWWPTTPTNVPAPSACCPSAPTAAWRRRSTATTSAWRPCPTSSPPTRATTSCSCPCKGGPYVAQLRFDPATGQLEPNQPARVASAPGAGPRHMDFHPNRRFAYVINEQAMTMTALRLRPRARAR